MLRPRKLSRKLKTKPIKHDLLQSCRLCGIIGGSRVPIIQETMTIGDDTNFAETTEIQINQKIHDCVSIEVKYDDKLPPLICHICLDKVNDFYEFRRMCSETNIRLHKALGISIDKPQPVGMVVSSGNADDQLDCILGVAGPVFFQTSQSNTLPSKSFKKLKALKKESKIKNETAITQINDDVPLVKREKVKVQSLVPLLKAKQPNRRELNRSKESVNRQKLLFGKNIQGVSSKHKLPLLLNNAEKSLPAMQNLNVQDPKQSLVFRKRKWTLTCQICGKVFPSGSLLQYHLIEHHSPNILQFGCTPCGEGFQSVLDFKNHHIWHKENSVNYNCSACLGTFKTYRTYSGHIDRRQCIAEYEVEDYKCNKCNLKCETQNILLTHECVFNKIDCKFCGKIFSKPRLVESHERHCKYSFTTNLLENARYVKSNVHSIDDSDPDYCLPRKLSKRATRYCMSNKLFKSEAMEYNPNDNYAYVPNCLRKRNRQNKLKSKTSEQVIDYEEQLSNLLIKIEPEDNLLISHEHIQNDDQYKLDNVMPKPHLKLKIKKEHGTLNSTIIEDDVETSHSSYRNNKKSNNLPIAITQVKSIDQEEFDQNIFTEKSFNDTCKIPGEVPQVNTKNNNYSKDNTSTIVIKSEPLEYVDSTVVVPNSSVLDTFANAEENSTRTKSIETQFSHSVFEIKQELLTYDNDTSSNLNRADHINIHDLSINSILPNMKCELSSNDTYSDLPVMHVKSEPLYADENSEIPNINQNLLNNYDIILNKHHDLDQTSTSALPIITSAESLDLAKWNALRTIIKSEPLTQETDEMFNSQVSPDGDISSVQLDTSLFSTNPSHHEIISCIKTESLMSAVAHDYVEGSVPDYPTNLVPDFGMGLINSATTQIKREPIDFIAETNINSGTQQDRHNLDSEIYCDTNDTNTPMIEMQLSIKKETEFVDGKNEEILETDPKIYSIDVTRKNVNNLPRSPSLIADKFSKEGDIPYYEGSFKSNNIHVETDLDFGQNSSALNIEPPVANNLSSPSLMADNFSKEGDVFNCEGSHKSDNTQADTLNIGENAIASNSEATVFASVGNNSSYSPSCMADKLSKEDGIPSCEDTFKQDDIETDIEFGQNSSAFNKRALTETQTKASLVNISSCSSSLMADKFCKVDCEGSFKLGNINAETFDENSIALISVVPSVVNNLSYSPSLTVKHEYVENVHVDAVDFVENSSALNSKARVVNDSSHSHSLIAHKFSEVDNLPDREGSFKSDNACIEAADFGENSTASYSKLTAVASVVNNSPHSPSLMVDKFSKENYIPDCACSSKSDHAHVETIDFDEDSSASYSKVTLDKFSTKVNVSDGEDSFKSHKANIETDLDFGKNSGTMNSQTTVDSFTKVNDTTISTSTDMVRDLNIDQIDKDKKGFEETILITNLDQLPEDKNKELDQPLISTHLFKKDERNVQIIDILNKEAFQQKGKDLHYVNGYEENLNNSNVTSVLGEINHPLGLHIKRELNTSQNEANISLEIDYNTLYEKPVINQTRLNEECDSMDSFSGTSNRMDELGISTERNNEIELKQGDDYKSTKMFEVSIENIYKANGIPEKISLDNSAIKYKCENEICEKIINNPSEIPLDDGTIK